MVQATKHHSSRSADADKIMRRIRPRKQGGSTPPHAAGINPSFPSPREQKDCSTSLKHCGLGCADDSSCQKKGMAMIYDKSLYPAVVRRTRSALRAAGYEAEAAAVNQCLRTSVAQAVAVGWKLLYMHDIQYFMSFEEELLSFGCLSQENDEVLYQAARHMLEDYMDKNADRVDEFLGGYHIGCSVAMTETNDQLAGYKTGGGGHRPSHIQPSLPLGLGRRHSRTTSTASSAVPAPGQTGPMREDGRSAIAGKPSGTENVGADQNSNANSEARGKANATDSRAENRYVESLRAENPRAENAQADSLRTKNVKAENTQTESLQGESLRAENVKAGHTQGENLPVESPRAESPRTLDARVKSAQAEKRRAQNTQNEAGNTKTGNRDKNSPALGGAVGPVSGTMSNAVGNAGSGSGLEYTQAGDAADAGKIRGGGTKSMRSGDAKHADSVPPVGTLLTYRQDLREAMRHFTIEDKARMRQERLLRRMGLWNNPCCPDSAE